MLSNSVSLQRRILAFSKCVTAFSYSPQAKRALPETIPTSRSELELMICATIFAVDHAKESSLNSISEVFNLNIHIIYYTII